MKKILLVAFLFLNFSCEKQVEKQSIVFNGGNFGGGGAGGNW